MGGKRDREKKKIVEEEEKEVSSREAVISHCEEGKRTSLSLSPRVQLDRVNHSPVIAPA